MQANNTSGSKGNPMNVENETELLIIPPIDAAAPAIFETASFGLG
jgi:hypothetical protein